MYRARSQVGTYAIHTPETTRCDCMGGTTRRAAICRATKSSGRRCRASCAYPALPREASTTASHHRTCRVVGVPWPTHGSLASARSGGMVLPADCGTRRRAVRRAHTPLSRAKPPPLPRTTAPAAQSGCPGPRMSASPEPRNGTEKPQPYGHDSRRLGREAWRGRRTESRSRDALTYARITRVCATEETWHGHRTELRDREVVAKRRAQVPGHLPTDIGHIGLLMSARCLPQHI